MPRWPRSIPAWTPSTTRSPSAPTVFDAYSSVAPDLVKTVDNATKISDTIVDQNDNLDALWSAPSGWPTSAPRCSPPTGSR
jgi:hypothetical protein